MAWGDAAAEQHEKDQPSEPLASGLVNNLLLPANNVREAAERFQAAMDEVRRASRGIQNELQKLEIYARERAGEVKYQYQSTEASRAYDDMADRIKALLGTP